MTYHQAVKAQEQALIRAGVFLLTVQNNGVWRVVKADKYLNKKTLKDATKSAGN